MLIEQMDHLSVWEVAHRWHGYDPNLTDPLTLPLPIQDTLRNITRQQFRHELSVCSTNGVVRKSRQTLPSFEDFVIPEFTESEIEEGSTDEGHPMKTVWLSEAVNTLSEEDRQDRYEEFSDNWTRRHDEAVKDFPRCFDQRVFRKADLEKVHVLRSDVLRLCELGNMALPAFWFSDSEREDHQRYLETGNASDSVHQRAARMKREEIDAFWSRLSTQQKHRLLCREIAAAIWLKAPDRNIANIIRDPAIHELGGGKYYGDDKTVREWIKDLDPRPPEMKKGGRPAGQ
ncbi:hypothetical protein [Marinobacter orientalis]|uniref:Uncharacterized protein n=1 Tax=Marinobacter orientalis TaxID=1928859 RepID=A0A7Y0RCF4_9GAMM|nr:hypothetical protein [Marinobacter orientalis]NMT63648.1 hypothetical protein [Marinobacter orientalis]TGX49763.1 hypothetical protein DIT72_08570 [Marinobacter orientalis]